MTKNFHSLTEKKNSNSTIEVTVPEARVKNYQFYLKKQLLYLPLPIYFPPLCKHKHAGSKLCAAPTIDESVIDLSIHSKIQPRPLPLPTPTYLSKTTPVRHLQAKKIQTSKISEYLNPYITNDNNCHSGKYKKKKSNSCSF